MKHEFQGGIVGRSNDSLGDEFLLGMVVAEQSETALLRRCEDAERGMRDAVRFVASLVHANGGELKFSDMAEAEAYDLIVYREESERGTILKTRKRTP